MAEVEIEKRSSMWPWLLAGLALLLVMGFFFLGTDGDHATVAGDPATTTTQPTTPRATDDMRTETTFPTGPGGLLVILTEPAVYLDQPVEGTALVAESVGDRGFWLTDEGSDERLLAVLAESLETSGLQPGTRVRLSGTAYAGSQPPSTIDGELDAASREALKDQTVFVRVSQLDKISGDQTQASTGAVSETPSDQSVGPDSGESVAVDQGNDVGVDIEGENEKLTFAEIAAPPQEYVGRTITAVATVVELDTDRGFWIEAGGNDRLFAVLANKLDIPDYQTDVDQGDKVRITGTVLDAKPPAKIPELEPTWDQAKKILSSEEVFLRITEVEHVDRQQANTSNV